MVEAVRPVRDHHTNLGRNNGGLARGVAEEVDKRLDPGCILNTKLTGFADRVHAGEREREVKSYYSRGEILQCSTAFLVLFQW